MAKIIYFIADHAPTSDELAEAKALGVPVVFRNARFVSGVSEKCDAVAGSIPSAYSDYPTAKEFVSGELADKEEKKAEVLKTASDLSDTPPEQPEEQSKEKDVAVAAWNKNA